MVNFDKIRILWIQDTDDIPPRYLPDGNIEYFDVITKSSDGVIWPVVSMKALTRPLEQFWFDHKTELFPVEIMAVDYDLSSAPGNEVANEGTLPAEGLTIPNDASAKISEVSQNNRSPDVDFDGLLLGIFYATLTHRHPVGFVDTTYRIGEMTASVPNYQKLAQKILGIEFKFAGTDRTWENIIEAGVQSLRQRMMVLCERHWCVFDMRDLQTLIQNPDHDTLRIRSPHAMKRLPVKGLFIDKINKQERDKCVSEWARSMLSQLSSYEELKEADDFAEDLWQFYNNDQLISQREKLSIILANNRRAEIPEELRKTFTPILDSTKPRCMNNCYDIRSGSHPDSVRRLAVLEIILRLLKRCILARKSVEQMIPSGQENSVMLAPDRPAVNAEDVYLALFPVPATPLAFHWHTGETFNLSHGWPSSLAEWSTEKVGKSSKAEKKRNGNLALKIQDVLDGKDWAPDEKTYGLTPSERHILRCKALSIEELSIQDWNRHSVASRILRWEELIK